MKYSVVTFGCRVNQADSLGFEEELRARGAVAGVAGRRRPRDRQYLFGDGQRRSGRAADDPARRARQSRRADRRHRLLRHPRAGRSSRPAERARGSCRTTTSRGSLRARCRAIVGLTTAERFGDGDGQLRRGDRAGRRRPHRVHAARADRLRASPAATASSRRRAARPRSVPLDEVLRRGRAGRRPPASRRSR